VVRRTVFLIGICGAVAVLFFVLMSLGMIFCFSSFPAVLWSVFVLLAIFFRPQRISGEDTN